MPYFHGTFCLRVTILKGKMGILGVKIIISRGKNDYLGSESSVEGQKSPPFSPQP